VRPASCFRAPSVRAFVQVSEIMTSLVTYFSVSHYRGVVLVCSLLRCHPSVCELKCDDFLTNHWLWRPGQIIAGFRPFGHMRRWSSAVGTPRSSAVEGAWPAGGPMSPNGRASARLQACAGRVLRHRADDWPRQLCRGEAGSTPRHQVRGKGVSSTTNSWCVLYCLWSRGDDLT